MKNLTFKLNSETKIPKKLIKDAPKTGRFDDYAEYIVNTYNIECPEQDAITYLVSTGAGWKATDLQDHNENLQRLVWIAVMNCHEQKTNYFYMGA
jgi:hypothetical protein